MLKTVIENKLCCRKSKKKKRENGFDQGRGSRSKLKKKGARTCEKTTDPTKTARFKGKMQKLTNKS